MNLPRNPWNLAIVACAALLVGAGGPWLVREIRSASRSAPLSARSAQRVVTLEVGGMTCDACVASVRTSIARVGGVSTVDVRLAQGRAYVVCGTDVPDTALTAAVQRAGPGFVGAVVRK